MRSNTGFAPAGLLSRIAPPFGDLLLICCGHSHFGTHPTFSTAEPSKTLDPRFTMVLDKVPSSGAPGGRRFRSRSTLVARRQGRTVSSLFLNSPIARNPLHLVSGHAFEACRVGAGLLGLHVSAAEVPPFTEQLVPHICRSQQMWVSNPLILLFLLLSC